MAKIKLKLNGFDDMIADIQRMGGDIDSTAMQCAEKSVSVLESSIKKEAAAQGAGTSEVMHSVNKSGSRISAEAGWQLGSYNSDNPSEGYRAMFVEFGTGKASKRSKGKDRKTSAGENRGSTAPHPFLDTARRKSASKIRKIQQDTLQEIIKGLNG